MDKSLHLVALFLMFCSISSVNLYCVLFFVTILLGSYYLRVISEFAIAKDQRGRQHWLLLCFCCSFKAQYLNCFCFVGLTCHVWTQMNIFEVVKKCSGSEWEWKTLSSHLDHCLGFYYLLNCIIINAALAILTRCCLCCAISCANIANLKSSHA